MKKFIKGVLFAGCFMFAVLGLNQPTDVKAADAPKKVREYYTGVTDVEVTLDNYDQSIKNVKLNGKKCVSKITSESKRLSHSTYSEDEESNVQTLSVVIKKYGTYKLTFDIVDKKGKKVESLKSVIYCYQRPIDVKVNGKDPYEYFESSIDNGKTAPKSGKVTVTSNKKNPIKKLEYSKAKIVRTQDGNSVQKSLENTFTKFKSGDKITFNTQPYYSFSKYDYSNGDDYVSKSEYMYTSFYADTQVRVTYKDQYTGKTEEYTVTVMQKFVK